MRDREARAPRSHGVWALPRTLATRYPVAFGLLAVTAAALVFLPARGLVDRGSWGIGYLLVITLVAAAAGQRGALVAALASFALWDFLFLPPYYTFQLADTQDWLMLLAFLAVGVTLGIRTAQSRQRETEARRRAQELELLQQLSADVLRLDSVEEAARVTVETLTARQVAEGAALFIESGNRLVPATCVGIDPEDVRVRLAVERAFSTLAPRPAPSDLGEVDAALAKPTVIPLVTSSRRYGVLYLAAPSGRELDPAARRVAQAAANLLSSHLEQARLREVAAANRAQHESQRLRSVLVSSVSHELKTPLASALARVTALVEADRWDDASALRPELAAVVSDLRRLENDIRDLLDLARLEGDSWPLRPESYEIGEILAGVLAQYASSDRERLRLDVHPDLPHVRVDFRQIARAIGTLVDNALAYSPAGTPVTLGARSSGGGLLVWVEDEGPGIPEEERALVFGKFYRGKQARRTQAGTGLGLAIERQVVEMHGGRTWVEAASGGGSLFVIWLPAEPAEEGA